MINELIGCILEFELVVAYKRPDPAVAIATIRRRELLLLKTKTFLCHKIVSEKIRYKKLKLRDSENNAVWELKWEQD